MSNAWDSYRARLDVSGNNAREASLRRELHNIETMLPNSLSYTSAAVFEGDFCLNITDETIYKESNRRQFAIINSDNLNEKTIISTHGEDIKGGSLVYWMDNFWIVTERDANTTIYTKAKMLQCNFLLKWVTPDHEKFEQWCIVEDSTKYLIGEMEDRNFVVTRGDTRVAMTITKNSQTVRFGRSNRFLLDDPGSPLMLAYQLTKPLKPGWTFNDKGVYKFVLQEVQTTANDNQELGIADYYKYFDKDGAPKDPPTIEGQESGRRGWI